MFVKLLLLGSVTAQQLVLLNNDQVSALMQLQKMNEDVQQ